MTNFDYSQGEVYAKQLKLVWIPAWVENFDQHAKAHGFSQAQVDICIQHHLIQLAHVFDPKTYSFKQKIILALHFLVGRKLK